MNLVTLNVSKTKFVTFSLNKASLPPSSFSINAHVCPADAVSCNCSSIEQTTCIKYLGVFLDSSLAWKPHIDSLVARVRKLMFVFKNLRTSVDFKSLKTVYYALAQSILSYCIISWGGAAKSILLRAERAQRAVLKVLTKKPIFFSTTDLFSLCQVPTVRQIFILNSIVRKHSQLYYNPVHINSKRRSDKICKIEPRRTAAASRHFYFISSLLYNKINKTLNIYPLPLFKCKNKCLAWLLSLSYDDTECLLEVSK